MRYEYQTVALDNVSRIYSGGTPSTKHQEFWNGKINWLSSGETGNRFIYQTERHITQAGVDHSSTRFAQKGSTVVASAGQGYTRGQAAYLLIDTYVNQSVIVFEPISEVIYPLFLFYNLSNRYKEFRLLSDGTSTRGGLSGWIVKRMNIDLPSMTVQKTIADFLYSIDQKIEVNNLKNENLYKTINALYNHCIDDTNREKTVGYYSESIYSGGTPSTAKEIYWDGPYSWLSSGETAERFVISTEKSITQQGVDNSSTRLAKKYDIVIASAGQGKTRGQTSMLLLDSFVNQSIIVIHAEKELLPFIFWNLSNRYKELRAISDSSSIRGSLTTKMISSFAMPLVDFDKISAFSNNAWSIILEIENNMKENIRLIEARDALLPRLMSGEIDVSHIAV